MKIIKLAEDKTSIPTNTFKIIREIGKSNIFEETLEISSLSHGMVGFYQHNDGNIYEVVISPLDSSLYKQLFEEQHQKIEQEKPIIETFHQDFENTENNEDTELTI